MSTSTSTKSETEAYAAELVDRLHELGLGVQLHRIRMHPFGTATLYLTYGCQTLPYLVSTAPTPQITRGTIAMLVVSLTLNMCTAIGDDGSPTVDRHEIANRDALEAIDAAIGREDPFELSNPGESGR